MSRLQEVSDAEAEKFMEKPKKVVHDDDLSDDEDDIEESIIDRIVNLKVRFDGPAMAWLPGPFFGRVSALSSYLQLACAPVGLWIFKAKSLLD